jgi:hypothetical protein
MAQEPFGLRSVPPTSSPAVSLRPEPSHIRPWSREDFLFLFFQHSQASQEAGKALWKRRRAHRRRGAARLAADRARPAPRHSGSGAWRAERFAESKTIKQPTFAQLTTKGCEISIMVTVTPYSANRLTVEVRSTPRAFQSRYEKAVPPLPNDQITALAQRNAPWGEMLDLVDSVAPYGFLVYHKIDADPIMPLAGDNAVCISYLMGNHTIAERMFRYEPSILLYAPLHTAIWGAPDGPAYLSFDRPSDQFSSFAHPDVATVGVELDRKMAALLDHLGTEIPDALLTT